MLNLHKLHVLILVGALFSVPPRGIRQYRNWHHVRNTKPVSINGLHVLH